MKNKIKKRIGDKEKREKGGGKNQRIIFLRDREYVLYMFYLWIYEFVVYYYVFMFIIRQWLFLYRFIFMNCVMSYVLCVVHLFNFTWVIFILVLLLRFQFISCVMI